MTSVDSRARTWDADPAKVERARCVADAIAARVPGLGHNGFDRADLGRRLERAGFTNVRFETVFEIAKETSAGKRAFPVFLAVAESG